eukprot:c20885_g1_i1 orf=235-1725(+)
MEDWSERPLACWHKGDPEGSATARARATNTGCATPRRQCRSMPWSRSSGSSGSVCPSGEASSNNCDDGGESLEELRQEETSPVVDSEDGTTSLLCLPLQSLSIYKQRASLPSSPSKERSDLIAKIRNGVDMKLDLEAVEKASRDSNESEEGGECDVRDGMADCLNECSCVLPFLFLGSKSVAQSLFTLHGCRITHILNCVGLVCPEYFPNDFFYKTLWLQDSPNEDIVCVLYDVFDFIEGVREQAEGRVFVHCCQGVSRSAALVIAYLMWRDRRCFEDAFEEVKKRHSIASPNMGFVFQLMQWQIRVLDPPDKEVFRMYRISPHSTYDPLHLVPKSISTPRLQALDSRGTFLIQFPNRLYVWRGKSSDQEMAATADRIAFQFVRYERAKFRILSVSEGNEPEQLQEALRLYSSQGVDNCKEDPEEREDDSTRDELGQKLVAAYDPDYEIFRKAKLGGDASPVIGSGVVIHLPARDEKWSRLRSSLANGPTRAGGKR